MTVVDENKLREVTTHAEALGIGSSRLEDTEMESR